MEPLFKLWKTWTDQSFTTSLDTLVRARKLSEVRNGPPPGVAQTPSDVAYTENKLRLLRYRPLKNIQSFDQRLQIAAQDKYSTPVLLVPSIINRFYILDLKPGRSVAEYLIHKGYDVWMLDWGNPGPEDRFVTFDETIDGHLLECVRVVLEETGQEQLSLLGYCIGGVLAVLFAALHGKLVRNLITLTTPINFHDEGLLSLWTRKGAFPVDLLVDTYGNMPAQLLQNSFKMLSPTSALNNAWTLWERLDEPERLEDFRALNLWVEDNVSVAGETYRKFVTDCYQDNLLMQNRMVINGRLADLRQITAPLFNVVAERDHIAPCGSASVLNELVSSPDKTLLQLKGGHVGAIVGREAETEFWPNLDRWLASRSAI